METLIGLLLDLKLVGRCFAWAALAGPALGFILGAVVGRLRGDLPYYLSRGFFLGALPTLNWLLWLVYNGITDRLGLDQVLNLVVNLGLFLLVGVSLGLAWRLLPERRALDIDPFLSP